MSRQTQAIIHADAILSNFKLLAELAPTSRSMAVVKADAYGHGAVNISRILQHVSCVISDAYCLTILGSVFSTKPNRCIPLSAFSQIVGRRSSGQANIHSNCA